MKNLIKYLISAITLCFTVVASGQDTEHYEVKIDGMGCPYCAYGVEKKFNEFEGMTNLIIKLDEGLLEFDHSSNKALTKEKIERKVKKAGYTLKEVKLPKNDTLKKTE